MISLLLLALAAAPFSSSSPNTLAARNGPVYSVADIGAFDSLAPESVQDRAWTTAVCQSSTPAFSIAAGAPVAGSGFLDAVDMNPLGIAGAAYLGVRFTVPATVTGVTVNANMQAGASQTGAASIAFTTNTCGVDNGHLAVTPTGTMATYSISRAETPPVNDYAVITINQPGFGSASMGDPIIGTVQVKPTGGTGFWAGDFYRVAATPKTLWYNTRDNYLSDGTINSSPDAVMVLDTDATSLAVEVESTVASSSTNALVVYVNGRPYATFVPTQNGVGEFNTFTLPAGMKRVEVDSSYFGQSTAAFDSKTGVYLQAVYVPASSTTSILGEPATSRRLLIYGDSIISGTGAAVPLAQGVQQYLRHWFTGGVYVEAMGGRHLADDIGDGAGGITATKLATLVKYIAAARPTDVWVQIGVNDYNNTTYTQAQFTKAYGALLDALHGALPNAAIYAQTLGITSLEATGNGNGDTPPNFRTLQTNACGARAFCTLIDGTSLYTSTYLNDTVHLKAAGHSIYARNLIAKLIAAPTLTAPSMVQPGQYLPTCSAAAEGSIVTKLGGSAVATKLCLCTNSDGAGTYKWCSINDATAASVCTGNTTTCN